MTTAGLDVRIGTGRLDIICIATAFTYQREGNEYQKRGITVFDSMQRQNLIVYTIGLRVHTLPVYGNPVLRMTYMCFIFDRCKSCRRVLSLACLLQSPAATKS